MRVFKVYGLGVGCWVNCQDLDEVQHDISRPEDIDPGSCDEDARPNPDLVTPVGTLISR